MNFSKKAKMDILIISETEKLEMEFSNRQRSTHLYEVKEPRKRKQKQEWKG